MKDSQHDLEISELNEKLTLANEELKINNEELEIYKAQLEELVTIRTQELKRSEVKYSNVFHHSPSFIIVSNAARGIILEISESFIKKIGYAAEELTGKMLTDFNITDKNQYKKISNLLQRQGHYSNQEITLNTKDKKKLYCLASGEIVTIGPHPILIETISDITELKDIEERLSLTEIRFSNFIGQSSEGVAYFRPQKPIDIGLPLHSQVKKLLNECLLAECNNAYRNMYGYESGHLLTDMTMLEISGEILVDDWLAILTQFVQQEYKLTNYQTSEICHDGTQLYFIHNIIGIIQTHKLVGLWSSRRNITELKKAEESLKYKNSLENITTGISTRFFNLSPELLDESIENALHEICNFINADSGFLIDVMYAEGYYRLTHSWTSENVQYDHQYFEMAPLAELYEWYEEIKLADFFLIRSPEDIPARSYLKQSFSQSGVASMILIPIKFQGNVLGIIGLSTVKQDRTWSDDEISLMKVVGEAFVNTINRKHSEKILIENEKKYREIFNATSEAIFLHDAKTGAVIDANQAALDLFGATPDELYIIPGKNATFDFGFEDPSFPDSIQLAIEKKQVVFEMRARRKNGQNFWAEVSLKSSEIGGDLKIITVVRDFSERRKNEEVIRQSEERFRSIIQYLTDVIWILDRDLKITYESPSSWQVLGYDPCFLIGKPGMGLIHPDDVKIVMKDLKGVFKKQNDYLPTEFRVKHSDGHWVSLEAIANNMLDHPAIQGIIITCRDITERKQVEKAMKVSESKFRNIFNNSSDAIIIVRKNFTILEVNEVFLRISGYTTEETLSMKLTDIISDAYLPQIVDKLIRYFQNESIAATECEIRLKSKANLPVEINSKLIEYEGEMVLVSILRDITERRQLENRILDTIITTEEKEREKFARNLHDELGPLLSSIKMYVNSLASTTDQQKHSFIISQLKQILTEAIQSTKELSNDLSPHILASYGLVAALEWFINQIKPHITVNFETTLKEERFTSSLELSIYRIIKELINNTIKHAGAESISINLHIYLQSIRLSYSDNGAGFPDNWQDNFDSMGMGMSNIMSRCRSINAVSKFYNHAPRGMSFEMDVQLESTATRETEI
jgi:PAS domain S-box-containing protein